MKVRKKTKEDRLKAKELVRPLIRDYLYGTLTMKEIAKTIDRHLTTTSEYMMELIQEMEINAKDSRKMSDKQIFANINRYKSTEFKDNDYTIKDWDIMTKVQREPYLVTELNY